jgi:glyoxylase-like metal-dependent hydrolase (beta-lactamase superfamily II)
MTAAKSAAWTVGSAIITRVEEQLGVAQVPPERYFRGFERDILERHLDWLAPDHYNPKQDRVITSVHSWLIRIAGLTILLDSCGGNHKDRPWSPRFHQQNFPFLDRLAAAGVRPQDIDVVMCTHLHADHTGWNTMLRDGLWVPTFPNARYLYSRTESDYWDVKKNPAMANDPRAAVFVDSVLPVVESGQAIVLDDGHSITDQLSVHAAPGHTPGHVVMRLDEPNGRAVFCGDVIHHALQVYAPHWNHMADEWPEIAGQSRRRLLDACADDGSLLFPCHFGAPHVAAIKSGPGGFSASFVPGKI